MPSETVSAAIGVNSVSEAIQRLSTMPRFDYVDSYAAVATNARDKSPVDWARAVLEETPLGPRARRGWQRLGFRLGPANSSDHVQGWRVAGEGNDWIRLEMSSWFATVQAVCQVDDEHVSLTVFVRHDRLISRLIWMAVRPMHQRAVPVLIQQALKRERGGIPDI